MKWQIPNDKSIFPCLIMREHVRTALRDCIVCNAQQCAVRIQTQPMTEAATESATTHRYLSFVKD
jgi:hypothetical protein